MPVFKDINARDWTVSLDGPKIQELRQELSFDILDEKQFAKLSADEVLCINVAWVLCREAAQAANVTDLQFKRNLIGDALDSVQMALVDAAILFFPSRKRLLLRSLQDKNAAIWNKSLDLVQTKINDPLLEDKFLTGLEQQIDLALSKVMLPSLSTGQPGATNSPESSASAPTG